MTLAGEQWDTEQVLLANIKEIEFVHTFPVYDKFHERAKEKEFVSKRWILTNTHKANKPDIRARCVGRQFKWKSPAMENTGSSTLSPLESPKYILSRFQSRRRGIDFHIFGDKKS